MLSILNELTLQNELQIFVANNMFWTKICKTTTTKHTIRHKNPCQRRDSNPGPLAPVADALPPDYRIN